jgi:hypothetical protein
VDDENGVNLNLDGAQLGDFSAGDVAKTIYNITAGLNEVTKLLQNDVDRLHLRVDAIERVEQQHAQERQSMTRLIMMLGSESHTVADVHKLLKQQIDGDAIERGQRRFYLDAMLSILIALATLDFFLNIYRVLRRPAGGL